MSESQGCPPTDDGEDEVCEDGLGPRLEVLRDVMTSYDWSTMLDVRDALFVSRLREALDLLGMDLALTVTASGGAELTISLGDESEVYRVPPHESSPLYALLIYAREVFSEAGLMPPIASPDDGRGIDLRLGRV